MASPCFPYVAVLQFTYSVQEVIKWARSKTLDTINIPPQDESLGATARFLLSETSTTAHTLSPHDHPGCVERLCWCIKSCVRVRMQDVIVNGFGWSRIKVKILRTQSYLTYLTPLAWVIALNKHDLGSVTQICQEDLDAKIICQFSRFQSQFCNEYALCTPGISV